MNYPEVNIARSTKDTMVGGQAKATRETEIPRELAYLDNSLDVMEKRFSTLIERLSPVLSPDLPSDPMAEKTTEPIATAFGNNLHQLNMRVRSFNDLLDRLYARLET